MDWNAQFEMFMPHGMCLMWRPGLMSLHVVSDGLIALAYFTIPFALWRFVRNRNDLEQKHRALALLFAAFIAFCGLTHVASIVVLWLPMYVAEGWLKAATAIVSMATAGFLIALIPQALKLPSLESLQREIAAHRQTMAALDAARAALSARVDRTEGELRVAEQHRHRSLALLNTLVETMPGPIYAKDRSGRLLLANKATLDLIGKEWPAVEGRRDDDFLADPRQAELVMANDRLVMESGAARELEEVVHHPDRGARVYLSTKVPFRDVDDGIAGMVGVSIDITERKQLSKELLHVSRRSAMGEMATAIAHEINQPLAAIALYLDGSTALLAQGRYDGPVTRSLGLAKDQCLRAGDIIRRLRSFVSGGDAVRRSENLPRLVDEACDLALVGAREAGIATSIVHDAHDLPVLVDAVQIEQVIVNLVRNAMDAMAETTDATLHVRTGRAADGMVMVSVADNGPGIAAAVAGRLFEPFISTKGLKGMGVGLSICRTIVEGHGGKIWVDDDAGFGATFRFTLPLSAPQATASAPQATA
jgi:two-component system sensor kinase FixL